MIYLIVLLQWMVEVVVSDIAIFVLKRDVKLQLTNQLVEVGTG